MPESESKTKETSLHKSDSEFDRKPFEFKGDGFEYFKIWIVNISLTILTLGVYSAWAKVRNNRYFYSNLYLDGHNFEYLASPITILKGRIVAVVVFAIYIGLSQVSPLAAGGFTILLLIFTPWIAVRSFEEGRRFRTGWEGSRADQAEALIQAGAVNMDPVERGAQMSAVFDIVLQEAIMIPLYQMKDAMGRTSDLEWSMPLDGFLWMGDAVLNR